MAYQIRTVLEHIEVYNDEGEFLFSADTQKEALEELQRGDAA